jgi:hypothetical protein
MMTLEETLKRYRERTLDTPEGSFRAYMSAEEAQTAGERQRWAPRRVDAEPPDEGEMIAALKARAANGWASTRQGQT